MIYGHSVFLLSFSRVEWVEKRKREFLFTPFLSDFITLNAKKQERGEKRKKGKPFLTSPGNPIFRFAVYREYFSNSALRNAHIQCCLYISLLDRRSPFSLSILFIFPIFQSGPRTYAPFLFISHAENVCSTTMALHIPDTVTWANCETKLKLAVSPRLELVDGRLRIGKTIGRLCKQS